MHHIRPVKVILENVGPYQGRRVERDFEALPAGLVQYKGDPGAGKTTEMVLSSIGTWFQWCPNRGDILAAYANPGRNVVELRFWASGRLLRAVTIMEVGAVSRGKNKGKKKEDRECHLYEWNQDRWEPVPGVEGKYRSFLAELEKRIGPRSYVLQVLFGFQRGGAETQDAAKAFTEVGPTDREKFFRDMLGADDLAAAADAAIARAKEAEAVIEALLPDEERLTGLQARHEEMLEQRAVKVTAVEQASDALEAARTAATAAAERLDALQARKVEAETVARRREDLTKELELRAAQVSEVASLGEATESYAARTRDAEAAQRQRQERLDDVRTAAAAADQAKRRRGDAERRIGEMRHELVGQETETQRCSATVAELGPAVARAEGDLAQAEQAENTARERLRAAQATVATAEETSRRRQDAQRAAAQAETDVRRLRMAHDQVAAEERTLHPVVEQARSHHAEYTAAQAEAEKDLAAANEALDAAREEWRTKDAQAKAARTSHETARSEADATARKVTDLQSRARETERTIARLDEEIARAQRQAPCLGEGKYAACELLKEATALRERLPRLQASRNEAAEALGTIRQSLAAAEEQDKKSAARATAAAERFHGLEAEAAALVPIGTQRKEEMERARNRAQQARERAEAARSALGREKDLVGLQARMAELGESLRASERRHTEAVDRLDALPLTDLAPAQAEAAASERSVQVASAHARTARAILARRGELDAARARLEVLEASWRELSGRIAAAEAALPEVDEAALAAVTTAEAHLRAGAEAVEAARVDLAAAERRHAAAEERLRGMRTAEAIEADKAALPVVEAPTPSQALIADSALATTRAAEAQAVATAEEARAAQHQHEGAVRTVGEQIAAMADVEERVTRARVTHRLRQEVLADVQRVLLLTVEAAGPAVAADVNEILEAAFDDRFTVAIVTEVPNKSNGGTTKRYDVMVSDARRDRVCPLNQLSGGEQSVVRLALQLGLSVWKNKQSDWRAEATWLDEPDASLNDGYRPHVEIMVRKFMELGGFRWVFLTTHGTAIHPDAVIEVGDGVGEPIQALAPETDPSDEGEDDVVAEAGPAPAELPF